MKNQNITPLDASEIQKLFEYLDRLNISYEDLRFEIVDHLATEIELLKTDLPKASFSKLLFEVTQQMPDQIFNKLIVDKENALLQYWKNNFIDLFASFFRIPQIILTVLIYFIIYKSLIYWGEPFAHYFYFSIMAGIPLVLVAIRKIDTENEENKFAILKGYNNFRNQIDMVLFILTMILYYVFKSSPLSETMIGIASLGYTFCIITVLIMAFHMPNKLIGDINTKFSHLNINIAR